MSKQSAILVAIQTVADLEGPTYLFVSKQGAPITEEMIATIFEIPEGEGYAEAIKKASELLAKQKAAHTNALEAKAMPQAEELRTLIEDFRQFQLGALQVAGEIELEDKTYTLDEIVLVVSDACGLEILPLPQDVATTTEVAAADVPSAEVNTTPAEQEAPGNLQEVKEAIAEAAEAVTEAVAQEDAPAIIASGNEFVAYIQKVNAGNAEMRKLLEEQAELVLKMLRNSNAQSAATDEVVAQLAIAMQAVPALPA